MKDFGQSLCWLMYSWIAPTRSLTSVEASTSERLLAEISKEALDHVQQGSSGRREVEMESRVPCEPGLHFPVIVRRVVVENDVELFVR